MHSPDSTDSIRDDNRKHRYQFSKTEINELLFDYNALANKNKVNFPKSVQIWDETLRDGEQTPGVFLNLNEKIEIAQLLNDIGTTKIAAGFPAISPNELENVKAIKALGLEATILGIARPRITDIDRCLEADLNEIVLFMPTSDLMLRILHLNKEEEIETIQKAFDYVKSHGLKFNWVSEDCTRSQPEHMVNVLRLAIENGAECSVIGDTVGVLQPESTAFLIDFIKSELKLNTNSTAIGIHTHNDFGLAVANTITAVLHGVRYAHVCVNGYGERAGNAAFEEVVVNLERLGIKTGIEESKITQLSKRVEEIFALPLSAHKPIVGSNAFSHESGLHINAIISHPISYEPINPSIVGQQRRLYLGKFSGTGSIVNALETKLKMSEITLPKRVIAKIVHDVKKMHESSSKTDIRQLFDQTKQLTEKLRSGLSDTEFFEIVKKHAGKFLQDSWAGENFASPDNSVDDDS